MGDNDGQTGLPPYQTRDTVCVNNARKHIQLLIQPMIDIQTIIKDNIINMEKYRGEIKYNEHNLDVLRQKVSMPFNDIEITKLNYAEMVCAGEKCSSYYQVGGITKRYYSKACHEKCKCKLRGLDSEVIGDVR